MEVDQTASTEGRVAAAKIDSKIKRLVNDPTAQSELCAELKTLYKYAESSRQWLTPGQDKIVLLYSDNLKGQVCAGRLEKALGLYYQGVEVEPLKITSLKVGSVEEFSLGLLTLCQVLTNLLETYKDREVILNATGGYKVLAPYLTLAGSLYQRKVIYIFEEAKELLVLPPLPVNLDKALLKEASPILNRLATGQRVDHANLPAVLAERGDFLGVLVKDSPTGLIFIPGGWLYYARYIQTQEGVIA